MQLSSMKSPQPVETGRGVSLLWQNRYLYSKYNPISTAINIASQTPKTEQTLYLIPSPLFCYGVPELLAELDAFSVVFCLESIEELYPFSKEGFERLLNQSALAKQWYEQGRLLFEKESHALSAILNEQIQQFRLRKITPIYLNGATYFAKNHYEQIIQEVTQSIALFWKNKSTQNNLSMLWYRNLFRNLIFLKEHSDSICSWKQWNPQHKPFFVLGAGESLEEKIPYLKANHLSFYLLAVDTALPALAQADLLPDAVIALEAQNSNLKDFLIDQRYREKLLLLADLICDPCLLHYFPKKILFSSQFDSHQRLKSNTLLSRLYQQFPQLLRIPPLGSVGNSALYLAHFFTYRQHAQKAVAKDSEKKGPFWAGLDFCYQRGKSHAKGSSYHQKNLSQSTRLKTLEAPFNALQKETRVSIDFPLSGSEAFRALPKYTTPVMAEYQKNAKKILTLFEEASFQQEALRFDEETSWVDREKIEIFLKKEKSYLEQGYHNPLFLEQAFKKGGNLYYLKESYLSGSKEERGENPFLKINIARLLQLLQGIA